MSLDIRKMQNYFCLKDKIKAIRIKKLKSSGHDSQYIFLNIWASCEKPPKSFELTLVIPKLFSEVLIKSLQDEIRK